MHPRHAQPLLVAPSAAFLPPRKATLLLAQISEPCVVAPRIWDLLPRRKRRQLRKAQVHAHYAVRDRQQRGRTPRAQAHMVTPRRIAREGDQIRTLDSGER